MEYVFAMGSPHAATTPTEAGVCMTNHDEEGFYPSDPLGVVSTIELRW